MESVTAAGEKTPQSNGAGRADAQGKVAYVTDNKHGVHRAHTHRWASVEIKTDSRHSLRSRESIM
jgi:hypothetical protein